MAKLQVSKAQLSTDDPLSSPEVTLHGEIGDASDITQSPRALNEEVIATPRRALERARRLFVLEPAVHESHPVEVAWGASQILATYGVTGEVGLWDAEGNRAHEPIKLANAAAASGRSRLMWDAAGAVRRIPGAGPGLHGWAVRALDGRAHVGHRARAHVRARARARALVASRRRPTASASLRVRAWAHRQFRLCAGLARTPVCSRSARRRARSSCTSMR